MKSHFFLVACLTATEVTTLTARIPTQPCCPVQDTVPAKDSVDPTQFTRVDEEATFPGGEGAWKNYLASNLRADVPIKRKAPPGKYTVLVEFVINEKGQIINIKPLTSHGYGMEAEVLRLIRKSPHWVPGRIGDSTIKAYRQQPVTFVAY